MRRLSLIVALLLTLGALSLGSTRTGAAQATPAGSCDPASLIAQISALKSTGDNTKDMQALEDIATKIGDLNVSCNGLTFSGQGSKVLDPFTIPAGDYRVKLQYKGGSYGSVNINGLKGQFCDAVLDNGNYQENTLSASEDCRATLKASMSSKSDKWTVTFEPLQ